MSDFSDTEPSSAATATIDTVGEPEAAEISVETYHYDDLADDLEMTVRLDGVTVTVGLDAHDAEELADDLAAAAREVDK